MKAAVALLVVFAVSGVLSLSFDEYVAKYNKAYAKGSSDYLLHKAVYLANVKEMERHNADPARSHDKSINHFTDMTSAERSRFLGAAKKGRKAMAASLTKAQPAPALHTLKPVSDLPTSVDWRTKGVVTPVKNQGGCGSCWAFASTETMESYAALSVTPPKQVILAPQQLVSCAPNPKHCGGTGGCEGSIAELAFDYVAHAGGMTTEALYPYTARDSACKFTNTTTPPAITVEGFVDLPANDYTSLMNAVATIGPIAVNVEADSWFSYSSGIFPASGCNLQNTDIDHVVQLVGYGTDAGKDYWIVRNSWGETWGEAGYIRLERTSDGKPCSTDKSPGDGTACEPFPSKITVCGTCGILYSSSYPTGVKFV